METTQNNNNNGSGILKAALAVAMLFIGFLGYLLYDSKKSNTNQEQVISQKVEQLATTKSRLDSVGIQLDNKIAEIKSLGGRVDELVAAKEQLEKDKKSLKNAKFFNQKQFDAKINEKSISLGDKVTISVNGISSSLKNVNNCSSPSLYLTFYLNLYIKL